MVSNGGVEGKLSSRPTNVLLFFFSFHLLATIDTDIERDCCGTGGWILCPAIKGAQTLRLMSLADA